jgi:predicted acetyltransferase
MRSKVNGGGGIYRDTHTDSNMISYAYSIFQNKESRLKIGGIHRDTDTQIHRQQGDLVSLLTTFGRGDTKTGQTASRLLFFKNKESRPKIK